MRWKLKKKEGEDLPRVKRDRTHPERVCVHVCERERERVISKVDSSSARVISLVFVFWLGASQRLSERR